MMQRGGGWERAPPVPMNLAQSWRGHSDTGGFGCTWGMDGRQQHLAWGSGADF